MQSIFATEFNPLERKQSSHMLINERRNFFRIEDTVLLRVHPIDVTRALNNTLPRQFKEDPAYSLMHELQLIDQENHKQLRAIADVSSELESYLKGLSKKIDLIAAKVVESEEHAADQQKLSISISEGGLSFPSGREHAHDSYLAIQLTLLPSQLALVLFCKVINCTPKDSGYTVALSFVNLKDTDRQTIAKHLMHLQLAERRQQSEEKSGD